MGNNFNLMLNNNFAWNIFKSANVIQNYSAVFIMSPITVPPHMVCTVAEARCTRPSACTAVNLHHSLCQSHLLRHKMSYEIPYLKSYKYYYHHATLLSKNISTALSTSLGPWAVQEITTALAVFQDQ